MPDYILLRFSTLTDRKQSCKLDQKKNYHLFLSFFKGLLIFLYPWHQPTIFCKQILKLNPKYMKSIKNKTSF